MVDGIAFAIRLVLNEDLDTPEKLFDPEALAHYFMVRGPLGKDEIRYEWLATAVSELVSNPFAPDELTEKARVAFDAFINFTDEALE